MDFAGDVVEAIRPGNDVLYLLDQRLLPERIEYLSCRNGEEVSYAIQVLAVRGAPAIGIAGAYGLWLEALRLREAPDFNHQLYQSANRLEASRPTAVNLSWALQEALKAIDGLVADESVSQLKTFADNLLADDIRSNRRLGDWGLSLFPEPVGILTHCNTGSLATGGYGTALGVIRTLFRAKKLREVFVDETRPLLQGARLTAWELQEDHIPARLITDSMAGAVMAKGWVDGVIVGADRIARNGDTANKIGTYSVAVIAHYHHIPFYVAAPLSTFDAHAVSGADILVEERDPQEVRLIKGQSIAPDGFPAYNPAFDVTPADLISAFITEKGVIQPPYDMAIARMKERRDVAE
ncbi:MAG: S-methyl-5-thioribose-1-phosphate isomerase [Firmicutes bacterium]|uniref:Methylthioribose-1-phosphate isomerase n=1 Tax=Sulfobacillus benefaciens TaxID=453960 RepID=A0A2T2WU36_9FIRM|nr:S-methyl-5-thioribose-1-phosphate isomerase [Bacillota bacterium]PSR25733.1 MAG: S-methyl-5-thioribose-1-phosphate isomerase [Sulfobacillus benefaciens]